MEWTRGTRVKVISTRIFGTKLSSIVQRLGVPKSTCQDWIKSGSTIAKDRSGRPPILSTRDLRQLKQFIQTDRETQRMSVQILKRLEFDVSESTLKKALKSLGFSRRIARRRLFLKNIDCF